MATRPTTPETLGPELVMHLGDLIPRAEAAEGTAALGEFAEELSIHYRAFGICVLADEADADVFFQWLIHSALTRRHYLATVGARGLGEPRYLRASFVDPLLDAVAARQWKLAGDIGRLSAPDWLEGQEYEDDFCYGDFLRKVVAQSEAGPIVDLLARWRRVLEGGGDPRLNVAEAFVAKDAGEFEVALRSLLQANERKAMEMADPTGGSILSSDYPFFPNRWVSVEGLALLAAAERAGIPVDFDLEACPRVARVAMSTPFRPRTYPNQGLD